MYLYFPVEESLFSPYLDHYDSFGIAAAEYTPTGWKQIAFLSDVSPDGAFVAALANRFTLYQLSPIHLKEVVEDAMISL